MVMVGVVPPVKLLVAVINGVLVLHSATKSDRKWSSAGDGCDVISADVAQCSKGCGNGSCVGVVRQGCAVSPA